MLTICCQPWSHAEAHNINVLSIHLLSRRIPLLLLGSLRDVVMEVQILTTPLVGESCAAYFKARQGRLGFAADTPPHAWSPDRWQPETTPRHPFQQLF